MEFGGEKKTATADASGKWLVKLDALPAITEPRRWSFNPQSAIGRPCRLLVGEVWLGSGQSNMAMTVAGAQDFAKEQSAANLPQIRMFREESRGAGTPQPDGKGQWTACSPETVGSFSATLFSWRRTTPRMKAPVGLINSSVGGTPIEDWLAAEAKSKIPEVPAAGAVGTKGGATASLCGLASAGPTSPGGGAALGEGETGFSGNAASLSTVGAVGSTARSRR